MYKLVGSPSTRAFRVVWMLEELGVEYEIQRAKSRSPEAVALNPSGKVPILLVGEKAIIDSTAIIQFLADKHEKFTFPAGTIDRAQQDSLLHFANDELDGTCWTAAKHTFAFPEEHRVSQVIQSCKWDWNRAMENFEIRLGNNKYAMGDEFTVPDVVITHVAGWAKLIGFDWPLGNVTNYFERVRSRTAFKRANEIRKQS